MLPKFSDLKNDPGPAPGISGGGACCAPTPEPCCCPPSGPAPEPCCAPSASPASSCCGGDLSGLPPADCGEEACCCGGPPPPPASEWERPGYAICPFTEKFMDAPAPSGVGPVPVLSTRLGWRDHLGAALTRCGIGRNHYTVAPGLYAVGAPDPDSPVLVTANYKLTFDGLRADLAGVSAWVLVLDTHGVNVWCAAGKGTFGTRELAARVLSTGLARVVRHRVLVLPQLGATGVQVRALRKACGFAAVFGPVRSADLPAFLAAGMKADEAMRRVDFPLAERLKLVPVELYLLKKPLAYALLAALVLAGFGAWGFSLAELARRGGNAILAVLAGILAGCVFVPALLPWLPGRMFAVKALSAGGLAWLGVLALSWGRAGAGEGLGLLLVLLAVASYTGMNFTGSTPYTSPSGVEKEMRRAMPLQAAGLVLGLVFWIGSAFL